MQSFSFFNYSSKPEYIIFDYILFNVFDCTGIFHLIAHYNEYKNSSVKSLPRYFNVLELLFCNCKLKIYCKSQLVNLFQLN